MKRHILHFTKIKYQFAVILVLNLILACGFFGCEKFVDVPPPITSITSENAYKDDATAIAVLNYLYSKLSNGDIGTGSKSISYLCGLSSDEFALAASAGMTEKSFFKNDLSATVAGFDFWNRIYPEIFYCNSAIEGLTNSADLTPNVKIQLIGEAKFLRAFLYFYLTNLYGDVPITTVSDYQFNSHLSRSSQAMVYDQIVMDLKDAKASLSSSFLDGSLLNYAGSPERVRPTKWAASALLARVFLTTGRWVDAEMESSSVISNSNLFNIVPITDVFKKNNQEAIWQLQPVVAGKNTSDAVLFILPKTGPSASKPVSLSSNLLSSFEAKDKRRFARNWIDSVKVGTNTFYYPYKYKAGSDATINDISMLTEYAVVLRLSEQYLIRAEARAQLGLNLTGAQSDLNVIRSRAGLSNVTANTQQLLINSIVHENQVEFFSEWGHRWLDLKRTKNVDFVMSSVTPQKGGSWQLSDQLYPLPLGDLQKNSNLSQNSGY